MPVLQAHGCYASYTRHKSALGGVGRGAIAYVPRRWRLASEAWKNTGYWLCGRCGRHGWEAHVWRRCIPWLPSVPLLAR